VDWASYPILEIQDAPERIDIVLINRPDLPASGAGEPRGAHGPGCHRQRHLRRDGGPPPPRADHRGAREIRAGKGLTCERLLSSCDD